MNSILANQMDAVVSSRLLTVSADTLLVDVASPLSETYIGLIVVCDSPGSMVGIVTKTNIVQQISRSCDRLGTTLASDVMTRDVTTCCPTDALLDILSRMKKSGFVHLPVIDERCKPSGVVYSGDALRALMAHGEYEAELLRDDVMGIGYQ